MFNFKNENLLFYVFVGFILLVCLKVYYESDEFNLKCVISSVDGNKYCVRDREKLKELIEICKMILADRDNPIGNKAIELLPTCSGFFFGDTAYDEYYYSDLQNTIDQLEPLLTEDYDKWEFYYRSSW